MAIFVCYRRADSEAITGRIDDHLRNVFGHEHVVRDVDNVPPGVDFVDYLDRALSQCDVCIAVIGRNWVTNRLFEEGDFVRRELETTLARNIPVVPLLVDGAPFPTQDQLPPSLQPLLRRNATRVDSGGDFKIQVNRLIHGIARLREEGKPVSSVSASAPSDPAAGAIARRRWMTVAAIALPLLAATIGLFVRFVGPERRDTQVVSSAAPSVTSSAKPPTMQPLIQTVTQQPVTAPVCPDDMAPIPAGQFFMGSDDKDALANEKPPHHVKLGAFCMDITEVSVAKYQACSLDGKCPRAGAEVEWPRITDQDRKAYVGLCTVADPPKPDHPINCVTWENADRYCKAQQRRLPTEAEWEFAARGKDGRTYPWGDQPPAANLLNACDSRCVKWGKRNGVALEALHPGDDGFETTAPVGKFLLGRSTYGPLDMAGNVWEWTADWYADYSKGDAENPRGPEFGDRRVIRGGAWNGSYTLWARPSFRYAHDPSARSFGIGFRCAKSP